MKKVLAFIMVIAVAATTSQAQQSTPLIKKIEVTGKAEKEVIPDEIYVRIALKEYKDGSRKVEINKLEAELVKAVKKLGLSEKNLTVDNIYGYNWDWRKKKSDEFLATKSFKLKVADVKMINQLIEALDAEGVNSMSIAEVSHSKLDEYKMDLKVEALKNAKAKAETLLKSIDEKLGQALEINDVEYGNAPPAYRQEMMLSAKSADSGYMSDLEFKMITIQSEVRAVFEIK